MSTTLFKDSADLLLEKPVSRTKHRAVVEWRMRSDPFVISIKLIPIQLAHLNVRKLSGSKKLYIPGYP
jgi:hypothetical protein